MIGLIIHAESPNCDRALKMISDTYDEGVLDALENLLFVLNVINVLALNDVGLLHRLYRVFVLGLALDPAHADITKRTYIHQLIIGREAMGY